MLKTATNTTAMITKRCFFACFVLFCMMLSISCSAQTMQNPQLSNEKAAEESVIATTDEGFIVPALTCSPTDKSVIINVVPDGAMTLFVQYGMQSGSYDSQTEPIKTNGGDPLELLVDGLNADTEYFFRIVFQNQGEHQYNATSESCFVTQRSTGSEFVFCVQADSHPERTNQFDPELYLQTMKNVYSDHPDFYIMMGDDFSVDEMDLVTQQAVQQLYINQREYLGVVSAPIFLVNGNHEKQARYTLDGTDQNAAVWGCNARNASFSQPVPDDFYTGDSEEVEYIGLLRDYYAFTWGDALFVVIDPYWHSTSNPIKTRNMWDRTLGDAQYEWLKETLEQSAAKYKFVFAHHLSADRGGTDYADQFEWGGYNRQGEWTFNRMRPGWDMPIHQLMVQSNVTAFFQGHDHLFAVQEKDGIIYQTLPMPSRTKKLTEFVDYYDTDVLFSDSGYLRVSVSDENVRIDYIATVYGNIQSEYSNGEVIYSYTLGN